MSRPIFKYRLSPSVLSLTAEEKNNNYHQLERLKGHESHDPFVLYHDTPGQVEGVLYSNVKPKQNWFMGKSAR